MISSLWWTCDPFLPPGASPKGAAPQAAVGAVVDNVPLPRLPCNIRVRARRRRNRAIVAKRTQSLRNQNR
jgi:hypothetical protein